MTFRPKRDFCQKKSDIFVTNNDKTKDYFCGGCYVRKKLNYANRSRPRNKWVSRQR